MSVGQFKIVLAIALSLIGVPIYPTPVQTQSTTLASGNRTAPKDPPPDNQREPGGGLNGGGISSCPATPKPLTLLLPRQSGQSLTTATHPTFWFYVPYSSQDVRIGQFSILTRDGKKRLYRTYFRLPNRPGIVSISLTQSPENTLQESEFYQWHVELYCQQNSNYKPDFAVNGWVQRVAMTPERRRQIDAAQPEIWFDSLDALANRLSTSRQDEQLKQSWNNLLKSVDLQELANEPLVGSVQVVQSP